MNVNVKKEEAGYLIEAVLGLSDTTSGTDPIESVELTAKIRVPHGEVLETMADPSKSRLVAATLVGRMTTAWKLDLIKTIEGGVLTALQAAVVGSLTSEAPED